ncbi:flagellar hook-basal body complex protein FliE [Legionella sp. CNM-4043-24]|uniref:flagellar hook-basal body complex protein FliE n=1 Tax=Legionella sp. CNM-4043-24 TaxID=3421646 RepID=UPI00403AB0B5
MTIEPITTLDLNAPFLPVNRTEKTAPSFTSWLSDAIADTNTKLLTADHSLEQLASGQAVSLHQSMLTMEEAKLSFQFLEQVRNRLMSAYQDILKEQI